MAAGFSVGSQRAFMALFLGVLLPNQNAYPENNEVGLYKRTMTVSH